jgi:hypothetical protein
MACPSIGQDGEVMLPAGQASSLHSRSRRSRPLNAPHILGVSQPSEPAAGSLVTVYVRQPARRMEGHGSDTGSDPRPRPGTQHRSGRYGRNTEPRLQADDGQTNSI